MKLNKISAGLLAGVLSVSVLLTGCNKINTGATLVTTDGEAVTLGYYNFAAKYQQSIYDIYFTQYFGEDMWTQENSGSTPSMEDNVKQDVLDNMQNSRLSMAHASEYGVELSDEEKAKISQAADAFMEANSAKSIRLMGATKEYIETYLTEQYYRLKVRNAFRDAQEITISDDEANQTTIAYAMISTQGTTNEETGEIEELSEEDKNGLKLKAENLTIADSASELESRAAEYGASYSTYSFTTSADPTEDSMGEEIIKAALALENGKTSDVIEVADVGYYVIHMVAKKDADATESKRQQLIETAKNDKYNELLESWKEGSTWEVDENQLKKVKFSQSFEISKSMQDALDAQAAAEEAAETEETQE